MLARLSTITRHFTTTASSSVPSQHQKIIMAAKDFVEDTIQSNKITVFSKSYCPYCKRAKNLFATKYADAEIKVIELDERDDGSEIQDYLAQKTGQRTVPNVFISKQHIGGCDDTFQADKSGKLATLISA